MPIETDLSVNYFDDHDPLKNYYKVLFKEGVAVQVREMNNLSTLTQEQIERLSNNLFKRGTIIDGCNFVFYSDYPYVKILDQQLNGAPAIPLAYEGNYVKNSSNLIALIIDSYDGFESTDPDLKTLYLKYLNSGTSGNSTKFAAGQALTIYNPNNGIEKVTINNGGVNFSNSDTVVFMSSMQVNVTSGSFTAGDILTQVNDTYTAYAEVLEVNTTVIPNKTVLKVAPREADLCNASINSLSWTFLANGTVANSTSIADIEEIIGQSASAEIVTNGSGKITRIAMQTKGEDYTVDPHVTVKSKETRASLGSLNLTAQTYICQVRAASVVNAVGNGYAFGVSEGVIYQKGYFVSVQPQTIIVEKYNTTPNNLSVVFQTEEEIVDSNIDTSLLDNVLGTENENAPGADRLKLTPILAVVNTESITGNDAVFPICEWSEGQPYKQNQKTSYDDIGDSMAERSKDAHGDFVVDRFNVTTRSVVNTELEANKVSIVVDPGIAYVSGYKTETVRNFVVDVDKGIDTQIKANTYISLNYGNYVKVNELAGIFQFDTADTVSLRSVTSQYISNTAKVETGTIAGPGGSGAEIGTARMRSLILNEGIPGTSSAIYYMYLFDVNMESGKNFKDVKSIYYDGGGFKGVCDVVLTPDATSGTNIAKLEGTSSGRLLFYCGYDSPKNANQVTYQYRTLDQTAKVNNSGTCVITLAATEEYFPYAGELSDSQEADVIVIPTAAHLYGDTKFDGTVGTSTSSPNLVGTSTTFFSDLVAGDYVFLSGNSTQDDIKRVEKVVNNTLVILDSNVSFTNSAANAYICFPKFVPIPINERDGYTANISSDQKSLRIYLNTTLTAAGNSNVAVAFNVERRNADQTDKTVKRNIYTKIRCNTHSEGTSGPWCLGVPDIIRLKSVYVESSLSIDGTGSDLSKYFYIDHNQNPNFYGLGYLYLDPYADLNIDEDAVILVKYDALTTSGDGFYTIASYVSTNSETLFINDSTGLSSATNFINTLEIPEVYDSKGKNYDLIDYFDFRPKVANTANLSLTVGGATINPSETISFGNTANPANNKKFPVPDATLSANIEVWLGRTDAVFLHKDGKITVEKGKPGTSKIPRTPEESMLLNTVIIPPYPSLPKKLAYNYTNILNKRIINERQTNRRIAEKQIETDISSENDFARHQPKVYTFSEIGGLERRIEDLEYYTALSLLEASMKDKVIGSTGNPTSERFKFGFFIDDFSTVNFIDMDNPEHAADIDNGRVIPEQESINVEHIFDEDSYVYSNKLILSQKQATVKKTIKPPGNTNVNTEIVSVYAKQKDKHKLAKNDKPFEEPPITVTMSTVAANSTIWFHMMDGADIVYLYQGDTLIATGDDVQQITDAEKAALLKDDFFRTNSGGPGGINDELRNGNDSGAAGDDKVRKAAKLTFTHQPAGGRKYTLQINKTSKVWRLRWDYPIDDDGSNPGDDDDDDEKKKKKKPKFLGKWKKKKKKKIKAKKIKKVIGKKEKKGKKDEKKGKVDTVIKKLTETIGQQKFTFEVFGLKPMTIHKLYVFGVDHTSKCRQLNPVSGGVPSYGNLKTDEYGTIDAEFTYTPPAGTKIDKHDYELDEEEMQDLGITIINSDGSSQVGSIFKRKKHNEEDLENAVKKRKDKKKKD